MGNCIGCESCCEKMAKLLEHFKESGMCEHCRKPDTGYRQTNITDYYEYDRIETNKNNKN